MKNVFCFNCLPWPARNQHGLRAIEGLFDTNCIIIILNVVLHSHVSLVCWRVGLCSCKYILKYDKISPSQQIVLLTSEFIFVFAYSVLELHCISAPVHIPRMRTHFLTWFQCESVTGPFCLKRFSSLSWPRKVFNGLNRDTMYLHWRQFVSALAWYFFACLTATLFHGLKTVNDAGHIFVIPLYFITLGYISFHLVQIHCKVYLTAIVLLLKVKIMSLYKRKQFCVDNVVTIIYPFFGGEGRGDVAICQIPERFICGDCYKFQTSWSDVL
jgi:hypothetical protein